jgi:hypothetical protein
MKRNLIMGLGIGFVGVSIAMLAFGNNWGLGLLILGLVLSESQIEKE